MVTESGFDPNPVLCGLILFMCSTIVITFYVFILVAIWRVSRTSPPFLLFFSHGCGAVGYQLNFALLSMEIIFGKEIPIPGRIMGTFIRIFDHSPTLHSVVIAMSRCFAVFMPLTYNKCAHNRKFFSRTSIACWIVAIILTFVQNFGFGPMSDDSFPTQNIQKMAIWPKSENEEEIKFQRAMEYVPLCVALSCLFFYLAALIKITVSLFCEGCKQNAWAMNQAQSSTHLESEKMRLFLICLFSYLPLLGLLLVTMFVVPQLDPVWSQYGMNVLVTLVSATEPLVLFTMSKPIRAKMPKCC